MCPVYICLKDHFSRITCEPAAYRAKSKAPILREDNFVVVVAVAGVVAVLVAVLVVLLIVVLVVVLVVRLTFHK